MLGRSHIGKIIHCDTPIARTEDQGHVIISIDAEVVCANSNLFTINQSPESRKQETSSHDKGHPGSNAELTPRSTGRTDRRQGCLRPHFNSTRGPSRENRQEKETKAFRLEKGSDYSHRWHDLIGRKS